MNNFSPAKAYTFLHEFLSNNIQTWANEADIPYLNELPEKYAQLDSDTDLQNRVAEDKSLQLELMDLVLQKEAKAVSDEVKSVIIGFSDELMKFPVNLRINKGIYYQYKLFVCNEEEEFNRILLSLIQKFRLENQNEEFMKDEAETV